MKSVKIKRMEVIVTLLCVGVFSSTASAQEPCWNIAQLTSDADIGNWPQIWGDKVVWESRDEIFLYNGTETIQLTDNDVKEWLPDIWGDNVVWAGNDGNGWGVFLYNGTETVQLTNVKDVENRDSHLRG